MYHGYFLFWLRMNIYIHTHTHIYIYIFSHLFSILLKCSESLSIAHENIVFPNRTMKRSFSVTLVFDSISRGHGVSIKSSNIYVNSDFIHVHLYGREAKYSSSPPNKRDHILYEIQITVT